ncbi:MAG: DM13 domain-containing protein [Nitrososphaera sp.]|uniref:DM13 domain-containing protein n=1 Tax=Nitrososphaera sp. TaxID=1971748 RepID=UPI00316E4082
MKRSILIAIIVAAVVVPGAVYAVSPYFTETMIDEPAPVATSGDSSTESMEKDDAMADDEAMMEKDGDAMMDKGDDAMMDDAMTKELSGGFQGAGDGIHNASGKATVLYLEDGSAVLRFENFRVTNGPDLYVYLSTDRGASDYVDLGRLKANSGNQNYELPDGVDLSKYDNVIIWCKSFSVYFGGAELGSA